MENCLHKLKIFKYGFTLAEVLITLVIIGVVAALTIPPVINKYKDEELKSQFKKAYSTITQAIYKTNMNDFYGYVRCYYKDGSGAPTQNDCYSFYSKLAKNLQTQKICNNNSLSEGCVPVYKQYYPSSSCWGYSEDYINNTNITYVLSDGQIIIPFSKNEYPLFLVDINGQKGPNAPGKDLFGFQIKMNAENNLYLTTGGGCVQIPPVSGGKTTQEMIQYALVGKK